MPTDLVVTGIQIEADPARVYAHFTTPDAIVGWMGDYALLDPIPGGAFELDINGVPVRGSYIELDPPHRLVISWGHAGSAQLPPGSSRVEIVLTPRDGGTYVEVRHSGLPEAEAARHAVGWNHFLDRLSRRATGQDPGPDPWAANLP